MSDGEGGLSDYYARFVESGHPSWSYPLRHPRATLAAAVDLVRLPHRSAVLPPTGAGDDMLRTLTRPGPLGTRVGMTGMAVLDVPPDAAEYSAGASKQTLRRKVRAATRAGVTYRPVTDPAERRALLCRADAAETSHADPRYQVGRPDNSDLLDHELWLAAFDAAGVPLLLSVTPIAGDWAHLRYFRTLGAGPVHSDSRYLMTQVLVEELSRRGVRHLVDGVHPAELPNGLRHFQRMVGFRLVRVSARRIPANHDGRRGAGSRTVGRPRPVDVRTSGRPILVD